MTPEPSASPREDIAVLIRETRQKAEQVPFRGILRGITPKDFGPSPLLKIHKGIAAAIETEAVMAQQWADRGKAYAARNGFKTNVLGSNVLLTGHVTNGDGPLRRVVIPTRLHYLDLVGALLECQGCRPANAPVRLDGLICDDGKASEAGPQEMAFIDMAGRYRHYRQARSDDSARDDAAALRASGIDIGVPCSPAEATQDEWDAANAEWEGMRLHDDPRCEGG